MSLTPPSASGTIFWYLWQFWLVQLINPAPFTLSLGVGLEQPLHSGFLSPQRRQTINISVYSVNGLVLSCC
jgi:hypothetical protein